MFCTPEMTMARLGALRAARFILACALARIGETGLRVAVGFLCIWVVQSHGISQGPSSADTGSIESLKTPNRSAREILTVANRTDRDRPTNADVAGTRANEKEGSENRSELAPGSSSTEGLRSDLASRIRIVGEASRPDWVAAPRQALSGSVYQITVSSGQFRNRADCAQRLDRELVREVSDYISAHVITDSRAAGSRNLAWKVGAIRNQLVHKPVYEEQLTGMEYGPLYERHALLELDADFRESIRSEWSKFVKTRRVLGTALGSSGVLGLLVLVFGYLKLDALTRRQHSTSLQLVTAAAILVLMVSVRLLKGWLF